MYYLSEKGKFACFNIKEKGKWAYVALKYEMKGNEMKWNEMKKIVKV